MRADLPGPAELHPASGPRWELGMKGRGISFMETKQLKYCSWIPITGGEMII